MGYHRGTVTKVKVGSFMSLSTGIGRIKSSPQCISIECCHEQDSNLQQVVRVIDC